MGIAAQAIINLVVAVGLTVYANHLSKKADDGNNIAQDKPNQASNKGSWVPRLIGRRRVGAVIGWVGGRTTKNEEVPGSGGKGGKGGGGKQRLFYEQGWHLLCVGPASALHKIYDNGKAIFTGPITPLTHPSGRTVSAGIYGNFRIFWGEETQPLNQVIANATGVLSRWKNVCYIMWDMKKLGISPSWTPIEYEIEVRPNKSTLGQSFNWYNPGNPAIGQFNILTTENGAPGVGSIQTLEDVSAAYPPGVKVEVKGQGGSDGVYTVRSVQTERDFVQRSITGLYNNDWSWSPLEYKSGRWVSKATSESSYSTVPRTDPGLPGAPAGTNYYQISHGAAGSGKASWRQIAWTHPEFTTHDYTEKRDYKIVFYLSLPYASDGRVIVFGIQHKFTSHDFSQGRLDGSRGSHTDFNAAIYYGNQSGRPGKPDQWNVRAASSGSLSATAVPLIEQVQPGWYKFTLQIGGVDLGPETDYYMRWYLTTQGIVADHAWSQDISEILLFESSNYKTFFDEEVSGFTSDVGTIERFVASETPAEANYSGANPAHTIQELLFSPFPHGAALDQSEFDIDSLEDMGVAFSTSSEVLPTHVFAEEGRNMSQVMALLFQDLGAMAYFDSDIEKISFRLLRNDTPIEIPSSLISDPRPQLEMSRGVRPQDRLSFIFKNRDNNYRDGTIDLANDALVIRRGAKIRRVNLFVTTDIDAANAVAVRREQEDTQDIGGMVLHTSRATKELRPGDSISVPGFDCPIRILEVKPDANSGAVELQGVLDTYGVPGTSTIADPDSVTFDNTPVADIDFNYFEFPYMLNKKADSEFAILNARGNTAALGSNIWASVDDTNFTNIGTVTQTMVAASLGTTLPGLNDPDYQTITDILIDIDSTHEELTFQNLSTDPSALAQGKQAAIIVEDANSSYGADIVFYETVHRLSDTQFLLINAHRGRMSSHVEIKNTSWSIGDRVYLLDLTVLKRFDSEAAALSGSTTYFKSQPVSSEGAVDISTISSKSESNPLRKHALVPNIENLNRANGSSSWKAGEDDVIISWNWFSQTIPRTGAGFQGAGDSVPLMSPPPGRWYYDIGEILTTGGYSRKDSGFVDGHDDQEGDGTAQFKVTQSYLAEKFGSEPDNYVFNIFLIRDGDTPPYSVQGNSKVEMVKK